MIFKDLLDRSILAVTTMQNTEANFDFGYTPNEIRRVFDLQKLGLRSELVERCEYSPPRHQRNGTLS